MIASGNGHTDIVKVLLTVTDIDVNIQSGGVRTFVLDYYYFYFLVIIMLILVNNSLEEELH